MKACVDCRYFQAGQKGFELEFGKCANPKLGLDPISGKNVRHYASTSRASYGWRWLFGVTVCGPKGDWFEAVEKFPPPESA